MSAPAISYYQLRKLDPCKKPLREVTAKFGGARKWGKRRVTVADAIDAGVGMDDLIWVASALTRSDKDVEHRLRMWMADVGAHVLYLFEKERPSDDRPRKAIETARDPEAAAAAAAAAWAAAAARDAAAAAARDAAWDAAWAAAAAAARDADAAAAAARDAAAAAAAARDAAAAAAAAAARDAAWAAAAARDAAAAAARDADAAAAAAAEESWQLERFRLWFGEELPEPWPLPKRVREAA